MAADVGELAQVVPADRVDAGDRLERVDGRAGKTVLEGARGLPDVRPDVEDEGRQVLWNDILVGHPGNPARDVPGAAHIQPEVSQPRMHPHLEEVVVHDGMGVSDDARHRPATQAGWQPGGSRTRTNARRGGGDPATSPRAAMRRPCPWLPTSGPCRSCRSGRSSWSWRRSGAAA